MQIDRSRTQFLIRIKYLAENKNKICSINWNYDEFAETVQNKEIKGSGIFKDNKITDDANLLNQNRIWISKKKKRIECE